MFKTSFFFLFIISSILVSAQEYSKAIEDNSFFIEEAYNQEYRVVQHIFTGNNFPKPDKEIAFSFTQEWPAFGEKHQLSYTIPYVGTSFSNGIGDVLLNYRYQLTEHDDFITSAPRMSLILPTGKSDKGFGKGKPGVQFYLPFSKRLSEAFTGHFNLGYTIIPNVERPDGIVTDETLPGGKADLQVYNIGGSLIWLATQNLNFMLEYLVTYANDFLPGGGTGFSTEHIVSPGLRYAINIDKLQLVPGIAVPVKISDGLSTTGVYLYLSFEHPY